MSEILKSKTAIALSTAAASLGALGCGNTIRQDDIERVDYISSYNAFTQTVGHHSKRCFNTNTTYHNGVRVVHMTLKNFYDMDMSIRLKEACRRADRGQKPYSQEVTLTSSCNDDALARSSEATTTHQLGSEIFSATRIYEREYPHAPVCKDGQITPTD